MVESAMSLCHLGGRAAASGSHPGPKDDDRPSDSQDEAHSTTIV
jgi:hypothetical protein